MKHTFLCRWLGLAGLVLILTLACMAGLGLLSSSSTGSGLAYAQGTVWHVNHNATGAEDGTSWDDAFVELQSALEAADPGDEVWVAAGTYRPDYYGDRTATFQLLDGVALYGGFSGTETSRDQRDWATNVTALSGDIGAAGDSNDNSYHVITGSGTDSTAVLDGFTVTGGQADGSDPDNRGGGMYNDGGSPTLTNVIFSGNSTDAYSDWSDAYAYGGGMYNAGGSPTLTNVTFSGNSVDASSDYSDAYACGGGMYNAGGSPTLINVIFSDNSTDAYAWYVDAYAYGGGMYNAGGSPTLINVTFSGNSSDADSEYGSAYACGGGIYNDGGSAVLRNCILWGNTADSDPQVFGPATVSYSDVQGGCPGPGNIDADPHFLGPGDWRLRGDSPAIDAGDDSALPADTADLDGDGDTMEPIPFDLAGNSRLVGAAVDMGAYEFAANSDRGSALPVNPGLPLTDILTTTDRAAWYVVDVPSPGSALTVTLTGLSDDYSLYLFAPAIDQTSGQLQDWELLTAGDAGLIVQVGDAGLIVQVGDDDIIVDASPSGNPGDLLDAWPDVRGQSNVCREENIGKLGNVGQLGIVGTLLCISDALDNADELITLDNTHELYGPFYVAVGGHTPDVVGQPYTLTAEVVTRTVQAFFPLTYTVVTTFTNLVPAYSHPATRTLILFNRSRFSEVFTDTDIAPLSGALDELAAHPQVAGAVIDLDDYAEVNDAYQIWNQYPSSPQAANFVATQIKFLLYNLVRRGYYPNLEYLVIVGGDRIIPYRRIRDEALVANERRYAEIAHSPSIAPSLDALYFLSDDYYANAGWFPLPWKGRELYLPHLAMGRLVETPDEIRAAIQAFLAQVSIAPADALVTGYGFLTDQAEAISQNLVISQGIATLDALISDTWTAEDLRPLLMPHEQAHDLNSLNAHFDHYTLFPASRAGGNVYAREIITPGTDYTGTLALSVGCHSGLNVPDADFTSVVTATDWPQAFLGRGGTFIGNTGYGYGDAERLAYSERLVLNFVEELNYWSNVGLYRVDGRPTVGGALLRAKQRYYNALAAGTFSNYDEKIIGQMTLYGLPMLAVNMPITTTEPPEGGDWVDPERLSLAYRPVTTAIGEYYEISSPAGADLQVLGARPTEPRLSVDISEDGGIVHGVLMSGGTFTETADFDPAISWVITDPTRNGVTEPTYPFDQWYPAHVATVNRFWSGGQSQDRLVVVPGQFRPYSTTFASETTTGTQRLYTDLELEIYRAPHAATDFIAPSIWQVQALSTPLSLQFRVQVQDDSGSVDRTVVLYRQEGEFTWTKVELNYNASTGWAAVSEPPVERTPIYYLVQAVDPTGNVALALDHGKPFQKLVNEKLKPTYLPMVCKGHYSGPDLVVAGFTVTDGDVQVAIENRGNRDAGPFWVDLYVDPDPPPTQANQLWYDLCRDPFVGISWWVDGLAVGESTTLTSMGGYAAQHTRWPGSLPPGRHDLYVYADTWRPLVSSGAVAESDETNNRAELLGVEVSAAGPAEEGPWLPVELPPRPVTPGE